MTDPSPPPRRHDEPAYGVPRGVLRERADQFPGPGHLDQQILSDALGPQDEAAEAAVEDRALGQRRSSWRKYPDEPLGEYIRRKIGRTDPGTEV